MPPTDHSGRLRAISAVAKVMAERLSESRFDEQRQARKVAEITGTGYFKDLRADANFYTADVDLAGVSPSLVCVPTNARVSTDPPMPMLAID